MRHEARIDQLRRIRFEEQRTPEEAAYYALLSLTEAQLVEVVARYNRHHEDRHYNRHVILAAEIHRPEDAA